MSCINGKKKGNVVVVEHGSAGSDSRFLFLIKLRFCPFMLSISDVISVGFLNSLDVPGCVQKRLFLLWP